MKPIHMDNRSVDSGINQAEEHMGRCGLDGDGVLARGVGNVLPGDGGNQISGALKVNVGIADPGKGKA